MIQLVFDAATAEEALGQTPALVGYSQHEGAESATWDDDEAREAGRAPGRVPGRGLARQSVRPVAVPRAQRADRDSAVTTRAGRPLRAGAGRAAAVGGRRARTSRSPGSRYLGHWGQQVSGPNSGPTGPTFKGQWTEPITWVDEEWRPDNVQVPASSSVAPTATGFFCYDRREGVRDLHPLPAQPVRRARRSWRRSCCSPSGSRAGRTGRPALPTPIRQRRDAGEIYRAGFRVYRSRPRCSSGSA